MNATVKSFEILARPELERFPLDERVGILNHPDEFALHRGFVGGLLCPYNPFTGADDALMMAFARAVVAGQIETPCVSYKGRPIWRVEPASFPQPMRMAYKTAQEAFSMVHPRRFGTGSLLINASDPDKPHTHETSMTYALFGEGTIAINEYGERYHIPSRHIFVFDREMLHLAPQSASINDIRVSFFGG